MARFSIAVSSTHGNSMGQRTIFLEFTCTGKTCNITSPPDSHVSRYGIFFCFQARSMSNICVDLVSTSYLCWIVPLLPTHNGFALVETLQASEIGPLLMTLQSQECRLIYKQHLSLHNKPFPFFGPFTIEHSVLTNIFIDQRSRSS